MEKRILIAGCSHYLREYIKNGIYFISNEYYLRMLYKKYDVYNLSKKNLTSKEAMLLVKAFLKLGSFDYCILSLGEGDMEEGIGKEAFRKNLIEIISICNYYGVKIELQNPLCKKNNLYLDVIDEVRALYNLDNINYRKVLLAS